MDDLKQPAAGEYVPSITTSGTLPTDTPKQDDDMPDLDYSLEDKALADEEVLEAKIARLESELREARESGQQAADAYQNLGEEMFKVNDELQAITAERDQQARRIEELERANNRKRQVLISVQDYLRANGRNFPAAAEAIEEQP